MKLLHIWIMISSEISKCICTSYISMSMVCGIWTMLWYIYGNAGTPFLNWKENMWRVWCYDPNMCTLLYIRGHFCLWNTDEHTTHSWSYYTYLGIHILFGKVMSRILWAVVLLSSKLSLTEIYMAGMTYKWNFWMWKWSTSQVVKKNFYVLRFSVFSIYSSVIAVEALRGFNCKLFFSGINYDYILHGSFVSVPCSFCVIWIWFGTRFTRHSLEMCGLTRPVFHIWNPNPW